MRTPGRPRDAQHATPLVSTGSQLALLGVGLQLLLALHADNLALFLDLHAPILLLRDVSRRVRSDGGRALISAPPPLLGARMHTHARRTRVCWKNGRAARRERAP